MKKLTIPLTGILFSESKDLKLEYMVHGNFIETKLFKSTEKLEIECLTKVIYEQKEKCIFTKKQFQNYLYTELWVSEKV